MIFNKIDLNQKTVQGALLELINTKKNIKWKKVGRYRLFGKLNNRINKNGELCRIFFTY